MTDMEQNTGKTTLHMPNHHIGKYDEIMKLDKDSLKALCEPLKDYIACHRVAYTDNTPDYMTQLMEKLKDKKLAQSLLKEEFAIIYESFASDYNNIPALAKPGTNEGICWETILLSPEIDTDDLKDILGRYIVTKQTRYWNGTIFPECLFFPLTLNEEERRYSGPRGNVWDRTNTYRYAYKASVLPYWREKFSELYFGKDSVAPLILENLPDDENLETLNFENYIPSDLTYLSALGMTGNPLSETKGTVPAAKMKSIRSSFQTGDFPDSHDNSRTDRKELLVYSFFSVAFDRKTEKQIIEPGEFVKKVMEKLPFMVRGSQFNLFLPDFRGFTKSWTDMSSVPSVTKAVDSLLKPSADGWMSLSNLKLRYLCCDIPQWHEFTYNSLFTRQGRSRNLLRRVSDNLESYEKSSNIRWFDELDFPFVLNWIKFLCAIGMVEIAIDKEAPADDALGGMRYARLTALGRYAYGIDLKYKAPATGESCQFEFDDSNLILTILSKDCPYALFLQQISQPIGNTRFKITPGTILKGCVNADDVESRIENLEKIVDTGSFPNLSSAVKEARLRTKCVAKAPKTYSIRSIANATPDFSEFLVSEKSIREHCLFAEKSLILIEKSFLPQFKTICNRNGYLINE